MQKHKSKLSDIAKLFVKLGVIGFGGPAVHIAMMEEEVVRKKKWMSHTHFLDLVGATNLIPGPNSTEMTMHIGHERAGWRGLILAGCCFISSCSNYNLHFCLDLSTVRAFTRSAAFYLWYQACCHQCYCSCYDRIRQESAKVRDIRHYRYFICNSRSRRIQ